MTGSAELHAAAAELVAARRHLELLVDTYARGADEAGAANTATASAWQSPLAEQVVQRTSGLLSELAAVPSYHRTAAEMLGKLASTASELAADAAVAERQQQHAAAELTSLQRVASAGDPAAASRVTSVRGTADRADRALAAVADRWRHACLNSAATLQQVTDRLRHTLTAASAWRPPPPSTSGSRRFRDQLAGFLFGDVLAWWKDDARYMPGSVLAGANRVRRVVSQYLRRYGPHARNPMTNPRPVVPTFANGLFGKMLRLNRPPIERLFQRAGAAGGVIGTVTGTADLIRQGNPAAAYQKRGAGYVADVAGTAFSASSATFFIAPNPVTAGAVIVTGTVWVGATVWDRRDQLRQGFETTTRRVSDALNSTKNKVIGAARSTASRARGAVTSAVGGVLDTGRSMFGRFVPVGR